MGLFNFLKKNKQKENMNYAKVLNGYGGLPLFSQFGQNIYASDVVQQAINCIIREMKKLEPQHVKHDERGYLVTVNDEIQRVLDNPNPLMTTSDFIEKIVWNLFFNYNSFVLPVYEDGKLTALYPLQPTTVEFLQDPSDELYVKMHFANDYEGTLRYADVIHIRYNYSVNELMGGDDRGQPNHEALLKTLELNDTLLQGVGKALKSSFAINGVVKYNTIVDGAKAEAALAELTKALRNNESGFMPLDLKGDFIPFNRQIAMVDATTLKFIDEKILRNFGVPLHILTGAYNKSEYEAFYQKSIEPLIVSMSQAFTKALFTNREKSGFGHAVQFYSKALQFMTTAEKIQYFTLLSNTGGCTINELRVGMGMKPLDDSEIGNTLIMSKNYGSMESVKDMGATVNNSEKVVENNNKEQGGAE